MLAEWGRFTTLAGLTAKTTLSSRKGAVTWAVALLPLYIVGGLLAYGETVDVVRYQEIVVPLFLQVVLIITALVHGTRLLQEEVEDNTLAYLTTRRLSKVSLVAYKFLGYLGSALVILLPPLAASYVLALAHAGVDVASNLDILGGLLTMAVVGTAGFGGIFLLMGFTLKRPLALGLLYGFLWESIFPFLPGDVPLLSISHYLWSIGSNVAEFGMLALYPTSLSLLWAILIPLLVGLATVVLTVLLMLGREVTTRE